MPTAPDSPELARAEVPAARVAAVQAECRRPVLASGCGAVSTFLAEPSMVLVGRAVSGTRQRHGAGAAGAE